MTSGLYGLLAEFTDPFALVRAVHHTRQAGYGNIDAHSPVPVDGLTEALESKATPFPMGVLIGGILGAIIGYGLLSLVAYPLNAHAINSWPLFLPIAFGLTIVMAALGAAFGIVVLNGLPISYHPIFNVQRSSWHGRRDGFLLCIKASDPRFDYERTRNFLLSLGPRGVYDIPA